MPARRTSHPEDERAGWWRLLLLSALVLGLGLCALAASSSVRAVLRSSQSTPSFAPGAETIVGVNLFGLANFNRQPVFTNLIAQTEWFSSKGDGWTGMPAAQLDRLGWIKYLDRGQSAPRPFMLSPTSRGRVEVHCTFEGRGRFIAGGAAQISGEGAHRLDLTLTLSGGEDEGAWIELVETDPQNYARNIDCRAAGTPPDQRFDPEFLAFIKPFKVLRFLDWQRTNDNIEPSWSARPLPQSGSQVNAAGASVEDMVDLANRMNADPWFLMPYKADEAYMQAFAQLVHDRLDPARTVYVELGNEVWNDSFDAAQQAKAEGESLGLGDGSRAQMRRYAQKTAAAMKIWTREFADRPGKLVRVAATQAASPHLAEMILSHEDTAQWVDAVAIAPYIWLDLNGYTEHDVDRVFAEMPAAIQKTMDFAEENGLSAARYGKRLIAYEGGQHLVTGDMKLAHAVQRDPRMFEVYTTYLREWDRRVRGVMMLYASTGPISEHGSWGLREYAGQPMNETPKLQAVLGFSSDGA